MSAMKQPLSPRATALILAGIACVVVLVLGLLQFRGRASSASSSGPVEIRAVNEGEQATTAPEALDAVPATPPGEQRTHRQDLNEETGHALMHGAQNGQ